MVKSEEEVVNDFNELVNMTADEIDAFLKTEASDTTGWSKDDDSGESIGHESGRKIVDILRRNPGKDPSKYTDEDKEHMRRVVSYCKRHLAQESKLKETKTPEEFEKTKSTRSLKNWGHDPLKAGNSSSTKPASKKAEKPKSSGKPISKKDDKKDEKSTEKPKSPGKPMSKKGGKAGDQKDDKEDKDKDNKEKAEEKKDEAPGRKPKSSGKPKSPGATKKDDGEAKKDEGEAETGEKREAAKAEKAEKPHSKKAKIAKEPAEPTRKPPSRGAKTA